jgi:hypothetical protein
MLTPQRIALMEKEMTEYCRQQMRAVQAQAAEAPHELRVFSILPRAAEMFRQQVIAGLDGNAKEALKAREVLRQMFDGHVDLKREGDSLWAEYYVQPVALLHAVPVGNRGGGGALCAL